MTQSWNYDKPHRCPECHAIWTYGPKYSPNQEWSTGESMTPRWWKTYDCYRCGAVFTGRWVEPWWRVHMRIYRLRSWLRTQNNRRKWVNRDRSKDL